MSGIPVYTSSPINASKAAGATPQTSASQEQTIPSLPKANPATTTTTATSTSSYPPAKPGAVAFPGPTPAATQRYAPLQPTPTSQHTPEGPPAPKPGAIPVPLTKTTIPPPPKAIESYHPPPPTASPAMSTRVAQPYPAQMSIPTPTGTYGAQPPSSSTSTTNTASTSYPVVIPTSEYGAPRRSIEHPPGYQQNAYAAELTSDQRRAQEASHSSVFGNQNNTEALGGLDSENAWSYLNTAKKWAQQAGEKMSAAEAEVWRKINKE